MHRQGQRPIVMWTASLAASAALHALLLLTPLLEWILDSPLARERREESAWGSAERQPGEDRLAPTVLVFAQAPDREPELSAEPRPDPLDAEPPSARMPDEPDSLLEPAPPEGERLPVPPPDAPPIAYTEARPEEPEPDARFLSDRSVKARDEGPAELPKGDPYMKGEDARVAFRGRRGDEPGPDRFSPGAGAAREAGRPEAAESGRDVAPAVRPAESPKAKGAHVDGARSDAADPAAPAASRPGSMGRKGPERDATGGRSEASRGREPGDLAEDAGDRGGREREAGVGEDARGRDAEREAAPEGPREKPASRGDDRDLLETGGRSRGPSELDELRRKLKEIDAPRQRPTDAPGTGNDPAGETSDRGSVGSGSPKPGLEDAVSDVVTLHTSSVADRKGETSFGTIENPVVKYRKELDARIDRNWKALISTEKFRVRAGQVTFRYQIDREGKIVELREARRTEGLSEEAAGLCRRAIEVSAPYRRFPSEIRSPRVTFGLTFLYD